MALSLRSRLSLAMALLVAAAVLLAALATLRRVEATFTAQFDARVASLLDAASARYAALGARAAQRMAGLGAALLADPRLAERLLIRPEPTSAMVLESATRMQALAGLDLLDLLDDKGRILSSGHWFERAGFEDPAALELPEGVPALRSVRIPSGELLGVVVRRDVVLGEARVLLVGGTVLGEEFLKEIAPGSGEALILLGLAPGPADDGDGAVPNATSSPAVVPDIPYTIATAGAAARLPLAAIPAALAQPIGQRLARIDAPGGESWSGGSLALRDAAGNERAALVVAVDRAELTGLLARLRLSFVVIGAGTTILAALVGAWISRRTTRPLSALVGTVEAISAGRSDAPFPRSSRDEVGRLIEAFSRMHQTLGSQQARLLAAERVAAWREVAQRVAHEVKNPLSPIRLTVENMTKARRQAPASFDAIFEEGSRLILEEVDQLGRIVSEFSEFARLPSATPTLQDLDALVDAVLALHAADPGLTVERLVGATPRRIAVDADQISRALKNLIGNAVEAMRPRGGKLIVRTAYAAGGASVEILDSGPGFSSEALGRLFEPYFTTKATGTGLGMAIAFQIAADHGGTLGAENRAEGGARVALRLPANGLAGAAARPVAAG
jgi:signal transduction histidine kinase